MLNMTDVQIILSSTHDKPIKMKQIATQCYAASLNGRFIVASDQLTTASLFLKAVQYVNCEYQEDFEDTKEAITIRISKRNRQHNGKKKKYKRTHNDLQNIKLKIEQHEPH